MSSLEKHDPPIDRPEGGLKRVTKKEQILSLYEGGITEVEDLAVITNSRPSYVAAVLQDSALLSGYFDLYTRSRHPMNVYSKFFAGKLGFRDEATARSSVELIDHLYHQFELAQDRSGQHHALLMALTMFNRARWTGKTREADIFRHWLLDRLSEAEPTGEAEAKDRAELEPAHAAERH